MLGQNHTCCSSISAQYTIYFSVHPNAECLCLDDFSGAFNTIQLSLLKAKLENIYLEAPLGHMDWGLLDGQSVVCPAAELHV